MTTIHSSSPDANLRAIRLLVFDVDGVLTNGHIIVNDRGDESKHFHVRDGFAMRAAMTQGLQIGIITGRMSRVVNLRMMELGIGLIQQGAKDKGIGLENLCRQADIPLDETAYMGDDLIDIPAMLRCGYPMTVADGSPEVRDVARYVTMAKGGEAAAREAIEHVLKAQNKWDAVVDLYGI